MRVFGADFSGARNPSRGIYYAEGALSSGRLVIKRVIPCDDRLDLFHAIDFSRAPWGLDFPFALSKEAMRILRLEGWEDLLKKVAGCTREEFEEKIAKSGLPSCEARCRGMREEKSGKGFKEGTGMSPGKSPGRGRGADQGGSFPPCCREVDNSIQAFSPLKKTNPNMRAMVYAGLKFLYYLRRVGHKVYPFDHRDRTFSRIYEVYPSHAWRQLGLSRNTSLDQLAKGFKDKYDFHVELDEGLFQVESLDAADAVAACVTMAFVLDKWGLEEDWKRKPPWITKREWALRFEEGLIVGPRTKIVDPGRSIVF